MRNKKIILMLIFVILSIFFICIKYDEKVMIIKYLSLIPFLIIISIIDIYTRNVYDIAVVSGIMVQGIIFIISSKYSYIEWNYILSLIIGIAISYILAILTKSLGEGDVGLYGLCCFALGIDYTVYIFGLSFILAFLYYVVVFFIVKFFKKDWRISRVIPFTPFISAAALIIIFTENSILEIYFDLIYRLL